MHRRTPNKKESTWRKKHIFFGDVFQAHFILSRKNSQQHTIQKVHVNKGNLGFCTFFFGHVIRVTENCLRFFILSLEHHWQKTPKHSRSHLNEPKFDWSWKCAFFVVEIDRPHEHCASKCSVDFFLLNKQTVIYALDRFTVEWPIFFVRFDVFAGMIKKTSRGTTNSWFEFVQLEMAKRFFSSLLQHW